MTDVSSALLYQLKNRHKRDDHHDPRHIGHQIEERHLASTGKNVQNIRSALLGRHFLEPNLVILDLGCSIQGELEREDLMTDWEKLEEIDRSRSDVQEAIDTRLSEWESVEADLDRMRTHAEDPRCR